MFKISNTKGCGYYRVKKADKIKRVVKFKVPIEYKPNRPLSKAVIESMKADRELPEEDSLLGSQEAEPEEEAQEEWTES